MQIFFKKYILVFALALLCVSPIHAARIGPIKPVQHIIDNVANSSPWICICRVLAALGKVVDKCSSYKGHTFNDSPTKLPPHQLYRIDDTYRYTLIFLTSLQLITYATAINPGLENPFQQDSYDVCHDQQDCSVQCCTIHDNIFITCCRFDNGQRIIECGEILMNEHDALTALYEIGPGNTIATTIAQPESTFFTPELKLLEHYTLMKEFEQISMQSLFSLEPEINLELEQYPILQNIVSKTHAMLQLSKNISLCVMAYPPDQISAQFWQYAGKICLSRRIFQEPYPVFLGIFGHEMGHAKQRYLSLQASFMAIDGDVLRCEQISAFMRRFNREINADIYGVLINKNALGLTQGILDKYEPDAYLENKKISTVAHCAFNNYDLYDHPEALSCRIPLILLLGEKYQTLDEELEQKFTLHKK